MTKNHGNAHQIPMAAALNSLRDIDKRVWRKLCGYFWRQWGQAGYRGLRQRGVSVREAWNTSKSAPMDQGVSRRPTP